MAKNGWSGDERRDDGLPDPPESWGSAIAPADCSALAAHAAQARRLLRRQRNRARLLQALGLPVPPDSPRVPPGAWRGRRHRHDRDPARPERTVDAGLKGLTGPVVTLALSTLALIVAMITLAMPALRDPNQPQTQSELTAVAQRILLTDKNGASVPLIEISPVVLLFVPECDCEQLIAEAAGAAPPGVTVAAVGIAEVPVSGHRSATPGRTGPVAGPQRPSGPGEGQRPAEHPSGARVLRLEDRTDSLRAQFRQLRGARGPSALFVRAGGLVVAVLPSARTVAELLPSMAKLA